MEKLKVRVRSIWAKSLKPIYCTNKKETWSNRERKL